MSSSKKEPIILTKENSNNQIIEITAYHLQDLSAVEKAPNLCKLNLIGGELKNFQSLEKCSKLQALNLRLTKVEDFSSLQKTKSIRYLEDVEIFSIPSIERLKLFVPREYEQERTDWYLRSLKVNLPMLQWLELEMPAHEFHIETLEGLELRRFGVTSKRFEL